MLDSRRCFIDSNIWLYAFVLSGDGTKTASARRLIQAEEKIVISSQVINEVSVNMIKKAGSTGIDIQQIISSFFANILLSTWIWNCSSRHPAYGRGTVFRTGTA